MRVALVNLKDHESAAYFPPTEHLGLAYLTAELRRRGHQTHLIDGDARGLEDAEVERRVVDLRPDLLGITTTHLIVARAVALAGRVKRAVPGVKVILGGHHATFAAADLFQACPAVDFIARGEGEITLGELADALHQGRPTEAIAGLWSRTPGGTVVRAPDRRAAALDALPLPARDTLRALPRGTYQALVVLTSRGCVGRCRFCNTWRLPTLGGGPNWRGRDPEAVRDEVRALWNEFGHSRFFFVDDNFIGPAEAAPRALEIARLVNQVDPGITMECDMRADSLSDLSTMVELRRLGLVLAYIGLESGSPHALRLYGKGVSVTQNAVCIRRLHRAGIKTPECGVILFHPYATLDEIQTSVRFFWRLGFTSLSPYCGLSRRLALYPGTDLLEQVRSDGLLDPSWRHDRVYAYRFRDPRVALVADAVLALSGGDSVAARIDALTTYLKVDVLSALSALLARVGRRSGTDRSAEKAARRILRPAFHAAGRAGDANCRAILELVDLARRGWRRDAFQEIIASYEETALQALAQLRTSIEKAVIQLTPHLPEGGV
ncbi:MAG: cobalamin-dependent protein [Acetobacteraceae bacterium]|nr:cobalamin-dependent protein [Acetobacteraceae bacterium]